MPRPIAAIPSLDAWLQRGTHREQLGHRLFVLDVGPRTAPPLVLLHGFPSASYDFWRVLPTLARERRVIVHDHPGLGLSAKPRAYGYSIVEQTAHALALWQQLGLTQVDVLAHDYGCSIATELMFRRAHRDLPLAVRSFTLVNSGLYYAMAGLRPVQHLLRLHCTRPLASRLGARWLYKRTMRQLWGTPGAELDAELDVLWQMTARDGGKVALGWVSEYLEERRVLHTARWNEGIRRLDAPAHVLWGDRDPVGVPAIALRLHEELPNARLTWLPGVGHYPMLEAPEAFADAALHFLNGLA